MDMAAKIIKGLLKLTWIIVRGIVIIGCNVASESEGSTCRRYTKTQAYELLYEDKITSAEFVECTKD